MPYRRFPKTDTARLRSLGELLENNDVYAAKTRFISMDLIAQAKKLHDQLNTLSARFMLCYEAQMRNYKRLAKPQKHMMMYLQHFVRVLLMGVERGEIKISALSEYYAIKNPDETLRQLHIVDDACEIAPKVIEGEKKRIAAGGRPIYNPTIGMVATHFDIFLDIYKQQSILNDKADRTLAELKVLRAQIDALLVEIWNAVEAHFADLSPETRYDECRKYGLIYYYRKGELKI